MIVITNQYNSVNFPYKPWFCKLSISLSLQEAHEIITYNNEQLHFIVSTKTDINKIEKLHGLKIPKINQMSFSCKEDDLVLQFHTTPTCKVFKNVYFPKWTLNMFCHSSEFSSFADKKEAILTKIRNDQGIKTLSEFKKLCVKLWHLKILFTSLT